METIEINLSKLLNTTGLTRKKVLVRKPGQIPFWSTRWVQIGDSVKETVEAAGFELLEIEGEEKPEPIDIKVLVKEAVTAGKEAFEAGITMRDPKDPALDEIIGRSDGSLKQESNIREGWAKGWNAANVAAPVPGVTDLPAPKDKGIISLELIKPAFEAGKTAYLNNEVNSPGASLSLAAILREGNNTVATLEQLSMAWRKGWMEQSLKAPAPDNFDTMPDVEPEPEPETPEPEHVFVGESLANRIDTKSKMKVPGVGTVPAITVKNIQIGDRLQFIEGVYRVKGVIVKGASSTIIFEETDDDGNNLKLKKQNRTFLGVERTQLKPGGYVPKPETGEPKVVPHWAREKTRKGIDTDKLISTASGFVPAKTVEEATDRLSQQFLKSEEDVVQFSYRGKGISLDGLKLPELNSIIHGMERTVGRYNIKLDHIGWNDKKQTAAAVYSYLGDYRSILFQKTATKNIKARHKKTLENFDIAKERNITDRRRWLTYKELRPGDHDRDRKKIETLNTLKRWTVDTELDSILLGTVVHEGCHAIYYQKNLKDKWHDNIEHLVGRELSSNIKCASVSEYGMTNMSELFAEVGVAVEFGIEIDPDVKQAYLNTMEGVK